LLLISIWFLSLAYSLSTWSLSRGMVHDPPSCHYKVVALSPSR
jgi:hypothetical protein